MSTKLEDLAPMTCAAALKALAELKSKGIQVVVTYTYRTEAEQGALFAQGRRPLAEVNALRKKAGLYEIKEYLGKDKKVHSDNEYTVTKCDGVRSKSAHQTGRALDVVPDLDPGEGSRPGWPAPADPRWGKIAAVFKAHGFEWGGDWKTFPDFPHYEYKG